MSVGLINRTALREAILEAAAEWQINRQRIPTELIETLKEDFRKQIKMRVASTLISTKSKKISGE
jgi:hypothetical protein